MDGEAVLSASSIRYIQSTRLVICLLTQVKERLDKPNASRGKNIDFTRGCSGLWKNSGRG